MMLVTDDKLSKKMVCCLYDIAVDDYDELQLLLPWPILKMLCYLVGCLYLLGD